MLKIFENCIHSQVSQFLEDKNLLSRTQFGFQQSLRHYEPCSNNRKPLQLRYIHGSEKELFANYLFNRKQAVCFGQELSEFHDVTCGVPQGSILGPLPFLLTFKMLNQCFGIRKLLLMLIYPTGKLKKDIENHLNAFFMPC